MSHFIKLGFVGSYKLDLLHYLSRTLRALNKNVAIVDASDEQALVYTIPDVLEEGVISYYGIDCLVQQNSILKLEKIPNNQYEILLIDYGFNSKVAVDYKDCDILFLITDFDKANVYRLKDIIEKHFFKEYKVVKIFRDVIQSKINAKYINHLLKVEEKANVVAEYVFERNEIDYRLRLMNQYDDHFKFRLLSKECKVLISDIIEETLNIQPKEIQKAIKRAQEGKVCR